MVPNAKRKKKNTKPPYKVSKNNLQDIDPNQLAA